MKHLLYISLGRGLKIKKAPILSEATKTYEIDTSQINDLTSQKVKRVKKAKLGKPDSIMIFDYPVSCYCLPEDEERVVEAIREYARNAQAKLQKRVDQIEVALHATSGSDKPLGYIAGHDRKSCDTCIFSAYLGSGSISQRTFTCTREEGAYFNIGPDDLCSFHADGDNPTGDGTEGK